MKRYALIEGGIDIHPNGPYVALADYEVIKSHLKFVSAMGCANGMNECDNLRIDEKCPACYAKDALEGKV